MPTHHLAQSSHFARACCWQAPLLVAVLLVASAAGMNAARDVITKPADLNPGVNGVSIPPVLDAALNGRAMLAEPSWPQAAPIITAGTIAPAWKDWSWGIVASGFEFGVFIGLIECNFASDSS